MAPSTASHYILQLWFLSFSLAYSQRPRIACVPLPYIHTSYGLCANLNYRSEKVLHTARRKYSTHKLANNYILRESYTTQNVLWSRASVSVCPRPYAHTTARTRM